MTNTNWHSDGELPDLSEVLESLEPFIGEPINITLGDQDDATPLADIVARASEDLLMHGESIIPVNVGTIGHCDYSELVTQSALKKACKRFIICVGIGLNNRNMKDLTEYINQTGLSLSTLDRRYAVCEKPKPINNDPSWHEMNRGKLSKKQRRKL